MMEHRLKIYLTTKERDLIVDETFAAPSLIEPLEERPVQDDDQGVCLFSEIWTDDCIS